MNAIVNDSQTLTAAHHQWASRPADERFTSLTAMLDHFRDVRDRSRGRVVNTRRIQALPVEGDNRGMVVRVQTPGGGEVDLAAPTNWSWGQLAERASAPASYLARLPSPLAADCINYGLMKRDIEDVGVLIRDEPKNPVATLAAATGPRYGRIWNADVLGALVDRFGDGVNGAFKVPGEFGQAITVNKDNTTLFASDRDFFVFLADEDHRIEIPGRRPGLTGSLARGFFIWNSEVGSQTFGISTFLYDYVCCNRFVWGATEVKEVRIRHTASAPDKYIEEIAPALEAYAQSSTATIEEAIAAARARKVETDLDEFLLNRFSRGQAQGIKLAFAADEGDRPMETLWDVGTGITAYARGIKNQSDRVEVERIAGQLLAQAA